MTKYRCSILLHPVSFQSVSVSRLKSVPGEKINLTENEKMLASESETAETLNNFFSNIVKKLNIPKFNSNNLVKENSKDPVFKPILKYKNHPNVLAIQKYSKNKTCHFEEVNIGEVEKEILKLDKNKASQKTDFALELSRNILIYLRTFYVRA